MFRNNNLEQRNDRQNANQVDGCGCTRIEDKAGCYLPAINLDKN